MPAINVDGLTFTFPAGWQASKYDEWSFYRNQFCKQKDGIAAVDLVALSPTNDAFLIEVKDYRHPQAVKPSQLPEAIANKVLSTLAALLPARLHANDPNEQKLSDELLRCTTLRIVLHVEQPAGHRPKVDLADIKQKLKRLLRAVDAHTKIVSMQKMLALAWTVT
jgi:hypothetical protein